ncbi:MAG: tetratricopeptide repeat protein, partial [Planktothrix sp.]
MSSLDFPPHSSDLESGLAALKRQDYQQAIAILEPIAQSEHPSKFKAQVGLVMAYERTGNTKSAITLCRDLTQCDQEKIQTWATDYLRQLLKRNPPKSNKTKSIDLENPHPSDQIPPSELPPIIETGFIPLNPNLQPKKAKSTPGKIPKPSSIPPRQKPPSFPVPQAPSLNLKKTELTFQKPISKIPS